MYKNISIAIICKDEERVIGRCIEAILRDLGENDEIIVVDTGSSDNTINILSKIKNIKVYHFPWNDNFAKARNFAISKASKDWVFFIDSDEVLVEGSIDNLKIIIEKCTEQSNNKDAIVFSPKVVNSNDTVVYNAGRIVPNDNTVEYEGCVHEYPVMKEKNIDLVSLKLSDVIVKHDGYEEEILKNKNKAVRNTKLIKKILKNNPNNSRYFYFYYRDAKALLPEREYEEGMLSFFERFPNDIYANHVAKDLADFYIESGKYNEAEKYINMLFESAEKGVEDDRYLAILLTAVNEIQKIKVQQNNLLKLLVYSQENILKQEATLFENGYLFDDLIGILFFQLEEYESAYKIREKLDSCKYTSNISRIFNKLKAVNNNL